MWGSLARGITETVKETASNAAASVAPHAGDVLRRVGEVVAPPDDESYDDDDEEEWEDDESYYDNDDDELGVEFENNDSGDEEVEEDGSPNLDRYRKKGPFAGLASAFGGGEQQDVVSNKVDAPTSANSLFNGDTQTFSEEKNIIVQSDIEKEEQLKQEAAKAEKMERERLAVDEAKAAAEQEKQEKEILERQKKMEKYARSEMQAKLAEAERLEKRRLAAEEAEEQRMRLVKETQRLAAEAAAERSKQERLENESIEKNRIIEEQAEAAEVERLEKEMMERERILEEERRINEEVESRRRAVEEEENRHEEEKAAAAKAAERIRIAGEEKAALQAAHEKAEKERITNERLAVEEAASRAECEKIERERVEHERRLERQGQTAEANAEAERHRISIEKEAQRSEAKAAAERAEHAKLEREMSIHEIAMEEQARREMLTERAEAENVEMERLAAVEAAEREEKEMERLERVRIEQLRQSEEQRRQDEAARQRAIERENEAAAERKEMAELERADKERLERLELERITAEEQMRAHEEEEMATAAVNDTRLVEAMQSQKLRLEEVNNEARESANQLAQVSQERNHLQNSNQELRVICEQLRSDLHRAAETISTLKVSAAEQEEKERLRWEQEARRFEEEESSLLAASKLDLENKMSHLRESLEGQIRSLECELVEERKLSVDQQHELQQRLEEATARLTMMETEMSALRSKKEAKAAKQIQASEKAAAKAVALLDKKEEELQQLQQVIADMHNTMKKNKVDEEEAEEEMDELHHENEELNEQLEKLQKENGELKSKMAKVSDDSEKLGGLKMELQMVEEERKREMTALESVQSKTSEGYALVLSERDAAKAQVQNLEQLLAAARADLELAQTDRSRAITANENLQRALEDFQGERDAEIALLSEQRVDNEDAIAAAHTASLEATREAAASEMRDVQFAASKSVQNTLAEMDKMETTIQECRRDNLNLRKALDEAIARLQTNQEDVIDRSLIKNIILDWHSKKGKGKRDVMVLLGSILHFTEDEKDKAFIGEGPGTLDKVYGAVAASLPPAKLNVDKLEGDTVREKWVNFLLAETGEDEGGS